MNTETKVEIRQNKWDNWHGYVNGRVVASFFTDIHGTQHEKAIKWQANMARVNLYKNIVSGTGSPGRVALAINGDFQETFETKGKAIEWALSWASKAINN